MTNGILVLANITNGLVFPHDDVCRFQSQWGHHAALGYFRTDAMPYRAIIHLLRGGSVKIVDATAHNKPLSDGQRYGVATWCLVFNRAIRVHGMRVCSWETPEMRRVARSGLHRSYAHGIRRLAKIYGCCGAVVIGRNVFLECHQNIDFDDRPEMVGRHILAVTGESP